MFPWSRKPKRAPDGERNVRQIERITHSAQASTLVIEFTDGEIRTHIGVLEGHIVGLRVAADRLDFYESQIAPSNTAIELELPDARSLKATQGRR